MFAHGLFAGLLWFVAADLFLARLFFASLEFAILAVGIAIFIRIVKIRSPRLISLLWLLVLIKPMVSIGFGSPISVAILGLSVSEISTPAVSAEPRMVGESPLVDDRYSLSDAKDAGTETEASEDQPFDGDARDVVDANAAAASEFKMPVKQPPTFSWPRIIVALWAVGVLVFLTRHVIQRWRLRRILYGSIGATAEVTERYRAIAASLNLRHLPRLLVTGELDSPALIGLLRPTVLIPHWMASDREYARLDWSLRHELTHWKWFDPLSILLADLVRIMFYFHPAAWWSRKRLIVALELACDRAVLCDSSQAGDYAEQLYQILARMRSHKRVELSGGLFATRTQVGRRIAALLEQSVALAPQITVRSALGLALLAIVALSVGGALKSEESKAANTASVARVIHFPADRSCGNLYIRDKNYDLDPMNEIFPNGLGVCIWDWEYLSQAQGDVSVPAGKSVQLSCRADTWDDLSGLDKLQPDDLDMVVFNDYPGKAPGDRCMPHLAHLTGLKFLSLDGSGVSSVGLRHLTKFKKLEWLSLNKFTATGIAEVAKLSSLKRLYLRTEVGLTDKCLAQLPKLKNLEALLIIANKQMTPSGLAHLAKLRSLKRLVLIGLDASPEMADEALAIVGKMSSLSELALAQLPATEKGFAQLSGLTNLERLYFNKISAASQSFTQLRQLHSLRKLSIDQADEAPGMHSITDEDLSCLRDLNRLEYLMILGSPRAGISDQGLMNLSSISTLKYLWLQSGPFTDAGLKSLSRLKLLEDLFIGGDGFTDAGVAELSKLTNLKRMCFSHFNGKQTTDAALASISKLPSLTRLDIGGQAQFSISGVNQLAESKSLTEIRIGSKVAQDNSTLDLRGLKGLKYLSMSQCPLRDEDLACMAELPNLANVILPLESNVTDRGMAYLDGLKKMDYLRIGSAGITDAGLAHLQGMKQLRALDFNGNFTDAGLGYLQDLKSMDMISLNSGAKLSDIAIKQLREKLPAITRFDVRGDQKIRSAQPSPQESPVKVGQMAPPFKAKTIDGKEIQLEDYRGKVVLLYFWATWCTPCMKSTPAIKTNYEEFSKHKDFAMVSFSLDNIELQVKDHVSKNGLSWPQVCLGNASKLADAYGVHSAPHYFVIDRDGKVLALQSDWEKIEQTLGNPVKQ